MQISLLRRPLALSVVLAAMFSGCQTAEEDTEVVVLVRRGHYKEALELAEIRANEAPESAEAQELFRGAQVANLLHGARESLFEGDPGRALGMVDLAQEIDPTNPTVFQWELKIKRQLSEEWLDAANDLTSSEDLVEAHAAYEQALEFDPQNAQAKLGISRVLLSMNYRAGRSKSYYNDGLEALRGYYLAQADSNLAKSLEYGETVRADARKRETEELLIEERVSLAQEFEREKLYFAARNEYRMAILIDKTHTVARNGYDRMDREVRAKRGLDEAEMDVRRGELEEAEETVAVSEDLTQEQVEEVAQIRGQIEDANIEAMYQLALEFERDYRYDEAILAYEELLAASDGYYSDADSRKATLEDFVSRAERLYGDVLNADSEQGVLSALREIDVFWPEYRDVPDRITAYVKRGNDIFRRARSSETPSAAYELLQELQAFWPSYPGLDEWMTELRTELGGD